MTGIRNSNMTLYPFGFPYISIKNGLPNEISFRNERMTYNQIICPQTTSPSQFSFTSHDDAIFIRFQPWALYNLTNKHASSFSDKYQDLSIIGKTFGRSLVNILEGKSKPEKKSEEIEKIILRSIKRPDIDERVKAALEYIEYNNGMVDVKSLSKKVCLSSRRVQQLFNLYIGLSPKKMASIYRLHKIIYDVMKNNYWSNPLDYHYDQAHFINDFKKLTNMSLDNFKKGIYTPQEVEATLRLNLYQKN